MGKSDYEEIGKEIMADGDFDARIKRAVEAAAKAVPPDETEGSDGFYADRRAVAMEAFDPDELGQMSAAQIATLFGMSAFSEDDAATFDALPPERKLPIIEKIDAAPYMVEGDFASLMNDTTNSKRDDMRETHHREEQLDDSEASYDEIAQDIKAKSVKPQQRKPR